MFASLTAALTVALGFAPPTAEERIARGNELFAEKDYEGAARELEQAYALDPYPRLLVAWAQAELYSGDCVKSLELYERYLDGDPPADDVAKVQPFIDQCRAEVSDAEENPLPPETDPVEEGVVASDEPPAPTQLTPREPPDDIPERARPWHRDPLGGALVGIGAAVSLAGVGLATAAGVHDRQANDVRLHGEFEDAVDRALLEARLSYGAFALGGALVIGGAVRYGVVARRSRSGGRLSVVPGPRSLQIRGRF